MRLSHETILDNSVSLKSLNLYQSSPQAATPLPVHVRKRQLGSVERQLWQVSCLVFMCHQIRCYVCNGRWEEPEACNLLMWSLTW